MVKRLTLIFLLLAGSAGATVDSTIGNTNWSTWNPGANDTLIVRNGDTLFRDVSGGTAGIVFVRSGGVYYENTGSSATIKHLYLGGISGAPFSSTNGGKWFYNRSSSTTFTVGGPLTYQIYFGANSTTGNNTRAGAENTLQCSGGFGQMYCDNTTADILLQYCTIKRFMKTGFNGGIRINSSGRTGKTRITHCTGDSTNIAIQGATGQKIDSCNFTVYEGQSQGVWLQYSNKDSIINTTITVNEQSVSTSSPYGIYANTCDSLYIYGSKVEAINEVAFNNANGIRLTHYLSGENGVRWAKLVGDTVIGFGFTVGVSTGRELLFDQCYIKTSTYSHEAVIIDNHRKWTARRSQFISIGAGGQSSFTCYPSAQSSVPDSADIFYNTFVARGPISGIAFEVFGAASLNYQAMRMVGNIAFSEHVGTGKHGIRVGPNGTGTVALTFTEFKKNAYSSNLVIAGSSITYPYSEADSNSDGTTAFGFVDSLAHDYRLAGSSPILNCGDSAFFVQTYSYVNPPGDPGYYQSGTTGSCGSSSPTPTGACCYNYTCAVVTQAQCTALGGTYFGDGTSSCTNCTAPSGTNPSPLSKQLRIGWLTYEAPWWSTAYTSGQGYSTTLRDWAANRANMYVGANTASDFSYIKTINPQAEGLVYAIFGRYYKDTVFGITQDTGYLRSWCDSMFTRTGDVNYRYDSMLLKSAGAGFTVNPNGQGNRTSTSGQVGQYLYYGPYSIRYMFDLRNYRVGQYLYKRFKDQITAYGVNGIMMDEEGVIGVTGITNGGDGPPMPPFNSSGKWASGFNNFNRPWGTTNFTTIGDSLKQLRNFHWGKVLGDSMAAHNYWLMPNGAAYWGPHASNPNNWTNEALGAIDAYRGALLGENYGFAAMAGAGGGALTANRHLIGRLYGIRDSGYRIGVWFECGPYDSASYLISQRRYKMGALGLMLMGTFPGTTNYYWIPNPGYNYTNFRMPQSTSPQDYAVDTTWLWSYAWGKYFGVPMLTRDSAQNSTANGNDPAGQSYTIWKVALTNPNNGTGDTLTYAFGRWYEGANIDTATTGVSVTLPGSASKKWYLLRDRSGMSGSDSSRAAWSPTVYTGGTSVKVGNAHWLVFSSDTVLANNGYSQTTTGTLSIDNPTTVEGSNMVFTVTLSSAQSVITNVNYITSPGSGAAITDYTDQSGTISFGIGQTTATISIPTVDRAGCLPSRTFNVTLYGATPATVTITIPTGTGTITDGDCGTPYNRTYKGKIVIKGKVRP